MHLNSLRNILAIVYSKGIQPYNFYPLYVPSFIPCHGTFPLALFPRCYFNLREILRKNCIPAYFILKMATNQQSLFIDQRYYENM